MEEADFVIVGAGPAGCALAARLADSPGGPAVALIETGRAKPSLLSTVPVGIAGLVPFRSRSNYAYQTTPQPGLGERRGYVPRGRGVGGSSLINAMIYVRGQPEDYDEWAAAGCVGWSWNDVLPLFKRAEDNARGASTWHGVGGPLPVSDLASPSPVAEAFIAAAAECQFPRNSDFNGPTQEGFGFFQVFQRGGRRVDAGTAYLGQSKWSKPRPNLTVLADTPARRVVFKEKRAIGVLAGERGRERLVKARREVILSAGAIGSPQLLLLSGIGPGAELREFGIPVVHDAPEVGENLQDHINYTANTRMRAPGLVGLTLPVLLRGAASVGAYRRGSGMLTSNVAEAGGFVRGSPDADRPDLQFHFCTGLVDDHNRKLHLCTGVALHVCVLRPASRGRVALASNEVEAAPLIDPRFFSAASDLDLLVRGVRLAHRIMRAPALARYGGRLLYGTGEEDDESLRALIRGHADSIYHPVGTCRMGADSRAVVEPTLRVRGVEGLRVADASIMPTIVSGNTQAPTAMIGEKAAELVLQAAA